MADTKRRSGKGISSDRDERKRRRQSEEHSPQRHRERDRSRSPAGSRRHPHSRREDHRDGRDRGRREERSSRREEDEHRRRREDRHRRDHDNRDRHGDRGYGRGQSDMVPKGKEVHHDERGSPHRQWIDKKKPEATEPVTKKVEPDFSVSGKLAAETNTLNGVLIKYAEPPEARIPKTRWRFYQFKGDDLQNTLYLHRQSAFLIGRDRKIVDFPIDHPSCSKQHAVLQYRLADYVKADGRKGKKVKPYVIDLESTNGTYVNNNRIDPRRYFELKEKDMVKFGFSSREYVLLNENSKESEDEGDPIGEPVPET